MRIYTVINTDRGYSMSCLDGCFSGQKAMVLCLHGFAGDKYSSVIERLGAEVREENTGTFTFDWPAHGDSKASYSDLTIDNCLEDIRTAVDWMRDHYGQIPLYLFATSFGGYLGMLFHQKYPDTFDRIFLRSPALNMADVMTGFMTDDQLDAFLSGQKLNFGFDRALILTRAFYDDVKAHDVFRMAPEYPEKIAIIHGEADDVVPCSDSRDYAIRYGLTLYTLPGADHRYKNPGDVDAVMEKAKGWFAV